MEGHQRHVRTTRTQAAGECSVSQQRRRHIQRRAKAAGILNTSGYYGFSSITADFDHDGWTDIYVACDSTPSILYHNNHDGTFVDIARKAGVPYNEDGSEQAGMGLSAADYTHSGLEDIVKTNFSDDTLTPYRNRGGSNFEDATYAAGLGRIRNWLGWGHPVLRFRQQRMAGHPDRKRSCLSGVTGKALGTSYREPKVAYYNVRNGPFANVTQYTGSALFELHSARGMALGDLSMTVTRKRWSNNMNEPPSLHYNTAEVGNFVSLRLVGGEVEYRCPRGSPHAATGRRKV